VLASASPRRAELLAAVGIPFVVRPAEVDEAPRPGESPAALVERLAGEKARAAVAPGELVLGADTVVAIGGEMLGKPRDDAEAAVMLQRLAGREHEVLSGVALAHGNGRLAAGVEVSRVTFAPLTAREIAWYVATGEPRDKAGAYAIQGRGALFVTAVAGSYSNVVGLPLATVYRLLREAGEDPLGMIGLTAR
jgi:septum formation protein